MLRVFRTMAICCSAAWLAAAETPVTGKVTAAGQPVPGAAVTVSSGTARLTTYTGDDGSFSLKTVPDGDIALEVRIFGFAPKTLKIAQSERTAPVAVQLELEAFRPARPAGAPALARRGFQNAQPSAAQSLEEQVSRSLDEPAPAVGHSIEGTSTEAFLIQGSLSRGLQQIDMPQRPGEFGEFGPGRFGPEGGANPDEPPAAFGGAGGQMSGGEAGGMGGRGGRGMGGPGGPGMGGPGMGGMRGPGGRGGPGSPADRLARLSPEERQRILQRMRERGAGSAERTFGNRAGRNRATMRGGFNLTYRSSALDAMPFFPDGSASSKPSYSQMRFGATIGGPLRIPRLIDSERTFVFINYTAARNRNLYSAFDTVPGAAERSGDFSAARSLIFDPLTRQPFPENRIPATRIDPAAAGLLAYVPLPNVPALVQNYQIITPVPRDSNAVGIRVNRSLNARDRIAVGTNLQFNSGESVQLFGFRDASEGSGQNWDVSWSHNFSSRLIHSLRARYNRNRNAVIPFFAYGEDVAGQLGIQGVSRTPVNYGPPNLTFTNYGDLRDSAHQNRVSHTFAVTDAWTIVRGAHTLRSGFEFRRVLTNSVAEQNARGTFVFTGLATSGFDAAGLPLQGTGLDLADFLLGFPQQTSVRYGGADTYLRANVWSFYTQEEWRARPNLTLSLGLRYEFFPPFTEKYGRMANLDISPDRSEVVLVTPGQAGPFTGVFPAGLIDSDANNFAPRLGLAWRPWTAHRFQVRTGYSVFYDSSVFNRIPTQLASQPPFAVTSIFNSTASNVLTLTDGFHGPESVDVRNTYAVNRHYPVPYAQTWNLAVQQDLPGGLTMEAGYLGTKGTRLVLSRVPNRAAPGSPTDSEDRRRIANAVGFTWDSPEGNAIFHAAQLRVTRRMRRGVSVNALYTFSKSIDNASVFGGVGAVVVQDENNLAAERGLSQFDRRHQLTLSTFLSSPWTSLGGGSGGGSFLRTLAKDWSATGALTLQSGAPFTARVLGNVSDAGGSGATGSARADATGLPVQAGSGYFNTLAFVVPAAGSFGNAGRDTIPGPGFFNLNASIGRSFPLGESGRRRRLDIRASASNATNTVSITGLGTVVNARNYGLATRAGNMRTLSLSMRVSF